MTTGTYGGRCDSVSTQNLQVVSEHQSQAVNKSGAMPRNLCTVSVTRHAPPSEARFSHLTSPEDSWVYFLPENTEFDILVPAHMGTLYLCLDQERLLEGARALNPDYWDKAPTDLIAFQSDQRTAFIEGLKSLLELYLAPPVEAPAPKAPLEAMLIDTALLAMATATALVDDRTPEFHARRRALQTVSRAREYIETCLSARQVPTLVDICTQAGVSERTLQYSFQHQLQISPITYVRISRLHWVRRALRQQPGEHQTVTEAATAWGFFHLSKFAQDYARLFGERPSETLARARLRQ
jgi:AraC family ethanolamine operon transcriptional activator